jgi:hypothetical protein
LSALKTLAVLCEKDNPYYLDIIMAEPESELAKVSRSIALSVVKMASGLYFTHHFRDL